MLFKSFSAVCLAKMQAAHRCLLAATRQGDPSHKSEYLAATALACLGAGLSIQPAPAAVTHLLCSPAADSVTAALQSPAERSSRRWSGSDNWAARGEGDCSTALQQTSAMLPDSELGRLPQQLLQLANSGKSRVSCSIDTIFNLQVAAYGCSHAPCVHRALCKVLSAIAHASQLGCWAFTKIALHISTTLVGQS